MKIIKLNAIASTNTFLKDLARTTELTNLTTVVTKNQTLGKGQRGNSWLSEPNKNLLFSTFVTHTKLSITHQSCLNFAVSLAVFSALKEFDIPQLHIKWPNDIMAGNKKICGILIENTLKNNFIATSIIGIGINVNQETFSEEIINATSMIAFLQQPTNLDTLLDTVLKKLSSYFLILEQQQFTVLKEQYLGVLYKKDVPTTFKDSKNNYFMGIIKGVSSKGKLQVQLDDDTLKEFDIKEIAIA